MTLSELHIFPPRSLTKLPFHLCVGQASTMSLVGLGRVKTLCRQGRNSASVGCEPVCRFSVFGYTLIAAISG